MANDVIPVLWETDLLDVPELTAEERQAMESIPRDAVRHWLRGERFNFQASVWVAPPEQYDDVKPDEYELESTSKYGGVTIRKSYLCPSCKCHVEYYR